MLFQLRSLSIQPNVINIHLARSARYRGIASGTKTNSVSIDIGQNYALLGKGFQRDFPLRPVLRKDWDTILNSSRSLKIFSPPIHSAGLLSNQHARAFYPAP